MNNKLHNQLKLEDLPSDILCLIQNNRTLLLIDKLKLRKLHRIWRDNLDSKTVDTFKLIYYEWKARYDTSNSNLSNSNLSNSNLSNNYNLYNYHYLFIILRSTNYPRIKCCMCIIFIIFIFLVPFYI